MGTALTKVGENAHTCMFHQYNDLTNLFSDETKKFTVLQVYLIFPFHVMKN